MKHGDAMTLGAVAVLAAASLAGQRGARSRGEYPWMSLQDVLRAEPAARQRGVSQVARSQRGFMRAYEAAAGGPDRMGQESLTGQDWTRRRENFIRRHVAQLTDAWDGDLPSRRHLALIMWAYTPTPGLTREWLKRQRRGSAAKGTRFVVRTPEAGLKLIRSKTYTDNWREALGVKPKHPVAVLVPCAGTKPFSQAPSHKHGYMPALEGLDVDRWVVAEPLGVVPWAWQDRYPNDAYDYPPDQLRGPARDLLIERIREWLERVGTRYERLVAALPGHHMALVREANAGVGLAIEDASITACRKSSCSRETFRATSRGYRKWLRERVR
jgi:hypothetical protein